MKIKILEKDIQKQIIDYLSYQKDLYFIRNNSVAGKFQRPDGSTGWLRNNKIGSPDIVICYCGLFVGLEVKVINGKQTTFQKIAQGDIIKSGGIYQIVRSVDDVIKLLEDIKYINSKVVKIKNKN